MFAFRWLLPIVLLTPVPLDARDTLVVAFNADDDNRNGVRDFQEPLSLSDNDVVIAWSAEQLPENLRVACDAPPGAIRFALSSDRKQIAVDALRSADPDWDGTFRLHVTTDERQEVIEGHVAPLRVRSSLAQAQTVFVREFPNRNERLIQQLGEICRLAGAELHVVPAGEPYAYNHIWLQDTVEFLEAQGAPVPMTVALSANRARRLDRFARDRLLGPGVGYMRVGSYRKKFAEGEGGVSWIDWYGNLEASPPTDEHPVGRILYGIDKQRDASLHPKVLAWLAAQLGAEPLALDVGWLTIKHVDEMVSFLPAKDGGFLVLVPDPNAALDRLRHLRDDGYGDTRLLDIFENQTTVNSVLDDADFVVANQRLWRERIEPMSRKLLKEIGVPRDRLRRMPVLFQPDGTPRTPNVVNCLVLPGTEGQPAQVAMADPNGPMIDGVDAFQAETRSRLSDANATLHFVDDRQYHKWSGNVHCATNAIRPLPAAQR
ncbi:protein-arginine deiminase family protein [Botrimarina hoheduenensis]|uniref:Protein-arginine deiminase (PAD) n=1 Tax=Botrimarina hoheduenensis TaxID=2528000 RepID=A0A5C5W9J0_9BACT|nr:protein-arginine deiminase family protein [Botrimarina hoheduenensis]TWT47330.1 Protein-arginine deiminase (PAD) [Botrimarina hoheduenensis]